MQVVLRLFIPHIVHKALVPIDPAQQFLVHFKHLEHLLVRETLSLKFYVIVADRTAHYCIVVFPCLQHIVHYFILAEDEGVVGVLLTVEVDRRVLLRVTQQADRALNIIQNVPLISLASFFVGPDSLLEVFGLFDLTHVFFFFIFLTFHLGGHLPHPLLLEDGEPPLDVLLHLLAFVVLIDKDLHEARVHPDAELQEVLESLFDCCPLIVEAWLNVVRPLLVLMAFVGDYLVLSLVIDDL